MTDNSYMFEILNFSKVNSKTSVDRNVTSIFKRYSSFILYHKIEISIVQICLIRKTDCSKSNTKVLSNTAPQTTTFSLLKIVQWHAYEWSNKIMNNEEKGVSWSQTRKQL